MPAVSLSLPVYKSLRDALQMSQVGQLGAGAPSGLEDVEIFVQKGRGASYGEGGFYTTLAKMLVKGAKALAPYARKALTAGVSVGKIAATEAAKAKAASLVTAAAASAQRKIDGAGHCGCGMRISGSGLRIGAPTRQGSGARLGHGMRVSA